MVHSLTLHDLTPHGVPSLRLRPLTAADIPALCALAAANRDEVRLMGTSPDTAGYYQAALDATDQLPFVIEVDGELAGSTRYGDIRQEHSGLEIGWTWLDRRWHGSGVNRRMKRLLLTYAFEEMGMERVQLKTDLLNTRSQRAIEKLGAVREGVLRRHIRRADGTLRDTVMYSVIRPEWPAVKAGLERP